MQLIACGRYIVSFTAQVAGRRIDSRRATAQAGPVSAAGLTHSQSYTLISLYDTPTGDRLLRLRDFAAYTTLRCAPDEQLLPAASKPSSIRSNVMTFPWLGRWSAQDAAWTPQLLSQMGLSRSDIDDPSGFFIVSVFVRLTATLFSAAASVAERCYASVCQRQHLLHTCWQFGRALFAC